MSMRRINLMVLAMLLITASVANAKVFKIATVAPEGTFWMQEMRSAAKQISEQTENRVKFKFYPGGVMGSDESVLRKIRIGQLQGGAVTAASLTAVDADIGIYELPYLFDTLEQVDYVRSRMDADLTAVLEKKGFVSFGFAEGGFSYVMSNEPLQSVADVRKKKVWLPSNHDVGDAVFASAEVTPVTLPISDVLTALQTGLIDTVITSPIGAIALQWHTKITHVVDEPLTYFSALLIVDAKTFNRVSDEDQRVVREVMAQAFVNIDLKNREDNIAAKQAMKNKGVKFVPLSPESKKEWRQIGDKAVKQLEKQNQYSDKAYADLVKYVAESAQVGQ